MKESSEIPKLQYGDIIGVDRGFYQHYGIYIGDNQVVHYGGSEDDYSKILVVHITTLWNFIGEEQTYFVCDFSKLPIEETNSIKEKQGKKIHMLVLPIFAFDDYFMEETDPYEALLYEKYQIYSPTETVSRAYSRLGECCQGWMEHNCEHFAFWCKTGIQDSYYTNMLIKVVRPG